jgi:hypothetical protein
MNTQIKWGMGTLVLFALIYRLVFNASIASNYEVPPGYTAPKSIAQIETKEKVAFEKALAEAQPEQEKVVKPIVKVKSAIIAKRKTPVRRKIAKMVSLKNRLKTKNRQKKI